MRRHATARPILAARLDVAAAMFLVSVALRISFRSQLVYHWDGAQLALAIREYNVALNQPHAPGYFLYVMLGRLVNFFVHDAHGSLVWFKCGVRQRAGSGAVSAGCKRCSDGVWALRQDCLP